MNKKNKTAVVLVSGGMDSALCVALAMQMGYDIAGLHLNYGQRTEQREKQAFDDLTEHFGFNYKLVVDVSHLSLIGGSSLTDKKIQVNKADFRNTSIPNSYVPFRNGNLLALAASWAEVIGAEAIFIGAMQLDSSGYPDCREDFFSAYEKAINLGTKPETQIKIITPIINYSKSDIIEEGIKIGVPFELTWSCYQNSEIACGECDSCALRLRGFQKSGIQDPINYEIRPNYI
jgi:7-cyano-7-deazaguanine synthase